MDIEQGSIIAYKHWEFGLNSMTSLPVLYSTIKPVAWPCGIFEAECLRKTIMPPHNVPGWDCTCGLYGSKDYGQVLYDTYIPSPYEIELRGQIEMFGKVIYHESGYRSQYCRVHSISPCLECAGCGVDVNIDRDGVYVSRFCVSEHIHKVDLCLPLCGCCYSKIHADDKLFEWLVEVFTMGQVTQGARNDMKERAWFDMRPVFDILCKLYCDGRRMEE